MKTNVIKFLSVFLIGISQTSWGVDATPTSVPVFPTVAWSQYLTQTGYGRIPTLFGFTPNYEGGIVQKIPLFKNTIPVIIRCEKPEGCEKYTVYGDTSTLKVIYSKDSSSDMKRALTLSSTSGGKVSNAIEYVYIPKDSKDHDEASFELSGNKSFYYGGHLGDFKISLIRRLVTNKGDIIAVIYINQERLKDSNVQMNYLSQSGQKYQFKNEYNQYTGLLTENAYTLSGVVWNHIDSTTLSMGTNWNKQESLQSGTSSTKTQSMGITAGIPLTPSIPFFASQVSTSFQKTWGKSFTISNSKQVSTSVSCQNPRDSGSLLVCGFYQAYGATRLVAPGLSEHRYNVFADFNRTAPYSNEVSLSIGDSTYNSLTDEGDVLGIIYPLAGTVYPEDTLITGVPTHWVNL